MLALIVAFASQVLHHWGFVFSHGVPRVSIGSPVGSFNDKRNKQLGQSLCSQGFWGNSPELLLASVVRCRLVSPSLGEGGVEQEGEGEGRDDGRWKPSGSEVVWALALTALLSVFSHWACLCPLESPLQLKPHGAEGH